MDSVVIDTDVLSYLFKQDTRGIATNRTSMENLGSSLS